MLVSISHYVFLHTTPPPLSSTLFPYTTLFRSPGITASPLRDFLRATVVLLQHSYNFEKAPYSGADCLIACQRISRSEEHTSELQSRLHLVCRLLLEKKNNTSYTIA